MRMKALVLALVLVGGTATVTPAATDAASGPQDARQQQGSKPATSQPQQPVTPKLPDKPAATAVSSLDYKLGPDDLMALTVLEAPELGGSLRVSNNGQVNVPLVGVVNVQGLSVRETESLLQEKFKKFIKNPHVTISVTEMKSHGVSVVGAVRRPGVIQVASPRPLLEIISLAEGLAPDAGEVVIVSRGGDPSQVSADPKAAAAIQSTEIRVRDLVESGNGKANVMVYPGDFVKVPAAGMIYVVGEVNQPGSFVLPNNGKLTVLQALALGQGLTRVAAKDRGMIVRTDPNGNRKEIPVDLKKIMEGKSPEIALEARDVLFVPNSRAKSIGIGTVDALVRVLSFRP